LTHHLAWGSLSALTVSRTGRYRSTHLPPLYVGCASSAQSTMPRGLRGPSGRSLSALFCIAPLLVLLTRTAHCSARCPCSHVCACGERLLFRSLTALLTASWAESYSRTLLHPQNILTTCTLVGRGSNHDVGWGRTMMWGVGPNQPARRPSPRPGADPCERWRWK